VEVVQLPVVRGIGPGLLGTKGFDGLGKRTHKVAAILQAFGQGEVHDAVRAFFEHAFAAAAIAGLREIEIQIVGQRRHRLLGQLLCLGHHGGESRGLRELRPRRAVGDRPAKPSGLWRQLGGDFLDPRGFDFRRRWSGSAHEAEKQRAASKEYRRLQFANRVHHSRGASTKDDNVTFQGLLRHCQDRSFVIVRRSSSTLKGFPMTASTGLSASLSFSR
jgi:hypothetical protein